MTTPNIPTPRTDAEQSNTKPKHELFTVWAARGWKLSQALERENVVLRQALQAVYDYVVDQHGEKVCDCDTHLPTCGPCLARAALTPPTTI